MLKDQDNLSKNVGKKKMWILYYNSILVCTK